MKIRTFGDHPGWRPIEQRRRSQLDAIAIAIVVAILCLGAVGLAIWLNTQPRCEVRADVTVCR
ncbi:MAG TPA: hypothetical protein VNK91_02095 [Burkholderiaceae bacterium]|nr:hypothetical protein [Burkholderiaceae bacterium]